MNQDDDAPLHVYRTHAAAEEAVRLLMHAGFQPEQLSLIGKGYHSEEHPVRFHTAGDRIGTWGGTGAFLGGFWGLLVAPAVFFLPGLGLVALAGPFVSLFVGALEGAAIGGGLSALGAALVAFGVPRDKVVEYENALTVDSYVLMIHGDAHEAHRARMVLLESKVAEAA